MTRQAAQSSGGVPRLPILAEHDSEDRIGLLLVAGDRGLAGAFNSQIVRAGVAAGREYPVRGQDARLLRVWPARRVIAEPFGAWSPFAPSSASRTAPHTQTLARSARC